MEEILFVGYSNLVRKRILPILQFTRINQISIAKHESQQWGEDDVDFIRYDNYEEAFEKCIPRLVYISTVNSAHYALAMHAIKLKAHVIIDKPATLSLQQTQKLVRTARENDVLVCESTVYLYHPQFTQLKEIIRELHTSIKHITVHFSFPPLNADNFRYNKNLGGGAIFDTGPYVASIGRFFFNEVPQSVQVNINESQGDLDLSYTALLGFAGGKSIMAFCSFDTEYVNRISLIGKDLLVDLDRVFTIPDDLSNKIVVRSKNIIQEYKTTKGNTFLSFFREVLDCLEQGKDYEQFYQYMLTDATILQLINDNKQ